MNRAELKEKLQHLSARFKFAGRIGRKQAIALVATVAALGIYAVSKGQDAGDRKLVSEREGEFKRSRMLGDPYAPVARAKERRLDKSARDYSDAQKSIGDGLSRIDGRLADLESRVASMGQTQGQSHPSAAPQSSVASDSGTTPVAATAG